MERNDRGWEGLSVLSVSIHDGISDSELDSSALGKQVRRSVDKTLYKHVKPGDIVLNMMRAWQGAIGVVNNEGMVSPAYITAVPNEKVYPWFMDYCLRRESIISQINNLSYGVTDFRKRIYWNSLVLLKCSMPSPNEQLEVTRLLLHFDNLITLHQRAHSNHRREKYDDNKNSKVRPVFKILRTVDKSLQRGGDP